MTEEDTPGSCHCAGSLFCATGSETTKLTDEEIKSTVSRFLDTLGPREDVLMLPPDYTRFHSQAGKITQFVAEYYGYTRATIPTNTNTDIHIMPALGTHAPMTPQQIKSMFGDALAAKRPSPFLVHDWRNDVVTIGHVPAEMVSEATYGMVKEPWPAQLNKIVWEKRKHDSPDDAGNNKPRPLVLSIGQVVPHEVMGMANFNKNLFVGVGGVEAINLSHFIGAVHGMESMMGQPSNPLRDILNYASKHFLQDQLDLWYVLTVMGTDATTGEIEMRGLYIGNDIECYNQACELSLKVNFTRLERSPTKMVVHLDEDEFQSTWLGNKAIYRTRMAIGTGGEIVILAPGVERFGEDDRVDELIRKYGYVGTPTIMKAMEQNDELKENLSAVAHLIHGSTEGRFRVTYCPGKLTKEEVESVGFQYGNLDEMMERYSGLKDGWCTEETADGTKSEFFYVSNPALGLWAVNSRFQKQESLDEGETANDTGYTDPLLSTEQTEITDSAGVGGWARPP
jgi:nickel-dependent lactate racemase